jgi:multidrug efflux pump subunit AcrA (membrane-fusion protein)
MAHNTLWVFLLIAVFAFPGCVKHKTINDELRKVRGAAAAAKEIPDEISGFGSLSFLAKVDIAAPQDGEIKKIFFREGDTVRQGQQALLLENPQIKLAVERAENNYAQALAARDLAAARLLDGEFQAEARLLSIEKAGAELDHAKRSWDEDRRKHLNQEALFEAGGLNTEAILAGRFMLDSEKERIFIMEKELEIRRVGCRDQDLTAAGMAIPADEADRRRLLVLLMTSSLRAELNAAAARLEAAEKELSSARLALEELGIRSPASGVIGARYFEEGERVKTGDKLLTLMDTASLYAIFPLREKDALRIEKGMSAAVCVDGTGEVREGAVDLVYPQADTQSLSFMVRVLLSGSGGVLKPGMFVRVSVNAGPPKKTVTIPYASVFNRKEKEGSVFVISGGAVEQRKLVLGIVRGEEQEIISGLAAGEVVVLRPDADLREGTHVTLVD